ncbi:MAG: glycosyltransferase [Deltaproteobacteria bacterium]|nr:glycosyltransferase [Deltaproteobacteria bacterium]
MPIARAWSDSKPLDRPGLGGLAERLIILIGGAVLIAASFLLDLGPSKLWYAREWLGGLYPFLAWPAIVMGSVVMVSMVWRLALWILYKSTPAMPASDPGLPSITVVIPAYNEGPAVFDCIRSVLASDYPTRMLRVIAVDDGSADDTWRHMNRAAAMDPGRVELVRLKKNMGKRRALYAGFRLVGSQVVVTVDSDTVLPRESLRALVTPLVHSPRVGAVAGRIEARNRDQNLLTRMLAVRYRIGFDFVRAYQSMLKSVFICPGAFTAYRLEAIQAHLKDWRDHRFMGRRCHNGDDHHLTNIVLRGGWDTVYQSGAEARTRVPHTFKGLSLMYLRWARSNIRESIVYLAFAPSLLASRPSRIPALVDAVARFVQIPLRLYLVFVGWAAVALHPALVLRSLSIAVMFSLIHAAVFLRSERSLDSVYTMLYSVFSLLTLQWIYPTAAVTIRQTRWLTR